MEQVYHSRSEIEVETVIHYPIPAPEHHNPFLTLADHCWYLLVAELLVEQHHQLFRQPKPWCNIQPDCVTDLLFLIATWEFPGSRQIVQAAHESNEGPVDVRAQLEQLSHLYEHF